MDTDKHRWGMIGMAVKGLLLAGVFVMAGGAWWLGFSSSPEMIIKRYSLMERRGEEGEINGRKMVAELVNCGPKAVPVLVEEIKLGWWGRGRAYFPQALSEIGQPGKDALIAAIDSEKNSGRRIYLITALHAGFQDYSRTDAMFDACRSVEAGDYMVSTGLEHMFGRFASLEPENLQSAPSLMVDKKLNEEFVVWWKRNGPIAIERVKMKFSQQSNK